MRVFTFPDVDVYHARNEYWPGQILKKVSGASVYQKTHTERPWGIRIHCNAKGEPHSVEFENGTLWSFCALNHRMLKVEWPMFVKDVSSGNCRARAECFFTDSMQLTIKSNNALLDDILIWKYPPRGGKNGLFDVLDEKLISRVLQIQRIVRVFLNARREARFTAVAMGLHYRLGDQSVLSCLYSDVLQKLLRHP
jgi:hypothetical protein